MLILINSLVLNIKNPRLAAIHATGNIKLENFTVGLILCSILPIAYALLRWGFDATSVFVAMIAITFISEVVAIFILRKYIKFSISSYWLQVYGRCALVAVCSMGPVYVVHSMMAEGFLRLIAVSATSLAAVSLVAYTIGIDREIRSSLNNFVKQLFYKLTVCR